LDTLSLEDLARRFEGPCPDGSEYALVYYEEVAHLIAGKGTLGVEWLQDRLDRGEGERLAAILFALTGPPPRNHIRGERIAGYLRDSRPVVVTAAVDGLRSQGNKRVKDQVLALLNHPVAFVRGSVLRYLARLYHERAVSVLLDALGDSHYVVRENAVDELDDMGC